MFGTFIVIYICGFVYGFMSKVDLYPWRISDALRCGLFWPWYAAKVIIENW